MRLKAVLCLCIVLTISGFTNAQQKTWKLHTIDNSSRGADGVRLADINHDNLPDIVTGWEEGGQIRICLHPGYTKVKSPWQSIKVGDVKSPEDAVMVDIDQDGNLDVISCSEGKTKSVQVHFAPMERADLGLETDWHTYTFPQLKNKSRWMYCLPMELDGKPGTELVLGSKEPHAGVGILHAIKSPADDVRNWDWHPLYKAGWVMSIIKYDWDRDGDMDILFTDRKGKSPGCYCLENPGSKHIYQPWNLHLLGGAGKEVMFMSLVDLDKNGIQEIAIAQRSNGFIMLTPDPQAGNPFKVQARTISMPENCGGAKAVNAGDINLDGKIDLVFTCEHSEKKIGVGWLSYSKSPQDPKWNLHDISGSQIGIKYDLIELIDLDNDGDLDVLTCEERDNLGVIWYENPTR